MLHSEPQSLDALIVPQAGANPHGKDLQEPEDSTGEGNPLR